MKSKDDKNEDGSDQERKFSLTTTKVNLFIVISLVVSIISVIQIFIFKRKFITLSNWSFHFSYT